ncbi:including n-acetylases of ribosomal protein [Lophiostoma macrostomum CBS 122681]|uniref:Including n-acetylases of ribosomal protein n=1 Tax=Lophiostoma macrostomum CBS 122681 TaxID=1314788 RepID=A0A6A6SR26_9PLEO|nr:including n-acetylases of ribosomal protein [Lophiostoma macrostomum CBS 122681]
MTDPNFHIQTPRLYISYFLASVDAHCDFFVDLYNSPEVVIANRGVPMFVANREEARAKIENDAKQQLQTGFGRFLVSLRPVDVSKDDKSPVSFSEQLKTLESIGMVSMKIRSEPGSPKVPDIGFSQLPQYCGKGYATEALSALLEYFEREKSVKEVLGFCMPDNENSKKMFKRLDFESRGVRLLKEFTRGGVGVHGLVFTKKGMKGDLSEYGL